MGSFLSIKNSIDSSSDDKKDNVYKFDPRERANDDFKEETVQKFWDEYLLKLKSTQPILYSVLGTTICRVPSPSLIHFEFPSNSAYDEFETLKENFFQSLKQHLNNYTITFDYKIKETQRTILLSNKDKYEKMKEINPWLEKLRNDFRLDI